MTVPRQIEPLGPLPPDPADISRRFLAKPHCRQVVEQYYGPISVRSFEGWPLRWIKWNSYTVTPTTEFIEECERRLARAEIRDRRVEIQDHAAA
jgi:hypothetical protein